jgi:hypothetical protein
MHVKVTGYKIHPLINTFFKKINAPMNNISKNIFDLKKENFLYLKIKYNGTKDAKIKNNLLKIINRVIKHEIVIKNNLS